MESARDFTELAGGLIPPCPGRYTVEYQDMGHSRPRAKKAVSIVVGVANVAFFAAYACLLVLGIGQPADPGAPGALAGEVLTVSALLMAAQSMVNVVSFTVASIVARDPVPVVAEEGHRVAFVTAIVPAKEPIATALRTLEAAQRIRYRGTVDVWLLDEGGDSEIRRLCEERGIRYFSRHGQPEYNTASGSFRAKTKHGNYNAWIHAHGSDYDFLASVDNDHTPYPGYLERTLGYLRDEDVAFVVGPQAYGNSEQFIARAAESQQFPFHSIIQRAANFYHVPMLVGTNYVIRMRALVQIGGFADSVTEDMATGIRFHTSRNERTGRRWRSVYTPDLLSLGEGPTTWGAYFSQQHRWSSGTFQVLKTEMLRRGWRLAPARLLHYALIANFYPSMALAWILGALNAVLNMLLGANGISTPLEAWVALYVDTTLFQLWVYGRNRRYNVSPVEEEGTFGLIGMAMSVLASPVYASALLSSLTGRKVGFVVTPKGAASEGDSAASFRLHMMWLLVFVGSIAGSLVNSYFSLIGCLWPALAAAVCLSPPLIYLHHRSAARRAASAPAASPAPSPDLLKNA